MDGDFFKRAMMEALIDRALGAFQQDPRRSVRNLVDLGKEASTGRFQAGFLTMAQRMLEREDSPYYDMAQNAVDHISRRRLKTFGVNFGWTCLTAGAHRIRALEQERHHNIPWSLTLHLGTGEGGLSAALWAELVRQGMDLGIYAYFLFPAAPPAVETAMALARGAGEAVFFLFLPAGWDAADFSPPDNVMAGVCWDGGDWAATAARLRQRQCLYGIYRTYAGQAEAEEIVSGRWVEEILPYAGVGTALLAAPGCPAAVQDRVYRYVLDARLGQRYPTLLADYYQDNLFADRCISDGPCFVGVRPDGSLTAFSQGQEEPVGGSVREAPLDSLLTRFPK